MFKKFLMFLFGLSRPTKRLVQVVADTLLIIAAFVLAMLLRLDSFAFASDPSAWAILIAVVPVTIISFIKLGLYRAVVRFVSTKALRVIAISALVSGITMLVVSQVLGWPIPRSVPIIYLAVLSLAVGGTRYGMRLLHLNLRRDGRKPVAIYGAGESGRQLLNALAQSLEYKPVLFIDDSKSLENVEVAGLTVLPFWQASKLLEDLEIGAILLAMPSVPVSVRRNIAEQLARLAVEVKTLPGMADLIEGKAKISELRDVSIEELLGRDPVPPKPELMEKNIRDKVVLVTGAGGSIGSELCRQIVRQGPKKLVLLEISEFALYTIHQELTELCLQNGCGGAEIIPTICSVQNTGRVAAILNAFSVETIYHAAAYKHVPLVEQNVVEGIRNNVFGTLNMAKASIDAGVNSFILISTDKAVRPTNFMGASKRLAELVCQAFAQSQSRTLFSMVRFGNVLGSSGSVIPRFKKQILEGGPITVTHKDINRFFMTIPEAAQLVIQAGSMAEGGDVFVLDMGEPVKILDLAQKMVRLHGLVPYFEGDSDSGDVRIEITGLRPGEKLYEELLIGNSPQETEHSRIMRAQEISLDYDALAAHLNDLLEATHDRDIVKIRQIIKSARTGFSPIDEISDLVWSSVARSNSIPKSNPNLRVIDSAM